MNTQNDKKYRRLRHVALVNVITQLAFPLAGAFSASVQAQPRDNTSLNQLMSAPVEPYTLAPGETVASVAKRHHLTVAQLKQLNELRTFSKPFTALGSGDELDVPKSPLQTSRSPFAVDHSTVPEEDDTGHTVAGAATRAAGVLGSGRAADAAAGQLTGMATGEASARLNKWLQKYGTARVQANVDQHGNLDGSQFDMLLPLYDSASDMAFTQYGLRRIDKRTTANLGLGHRHFFDDWMLGYNAFVDRDLTRAHTRAGLGLEYARDYLRLSTNGYMRLTGWKDSPDLEDYRERPANGFDIRAESWLPALPQLGGKLVYEQYFGDEVGLFGADTRQKDPHAITAGVNYTPVPLLTVGVDRRQGGSGKGETLFNLGVTYEIGTPWVKQISPDLVGSRRTLAGGRYDLVERNNQIVLEYQKKEVIRLSMPGLISGKAGQTRPLNTTVTSKYGLSAIDWQAPELLAAGGRIIDDGNGHYSLLLPQISAGQQQTFRLSGVARDTRGNLSHRATAEVVVAGSAVSQDKSTFEASAGKLAPDGKSKTTLTLTLKDKNGNPLTGLAGSIRLDHNALPGAGTDPTLGSIREVSPGVYVVDVTAGTKEGTLTVTPVVEGISLSPVSVVFTQALVPAVSKPKISGRLEIGGVLKGTYAFTPGEGDATDRSLYYWGEKGATVAHVATDGKTVSASGQTGDYTLTATDAGKVMELAVEAKNGKGTTGNVVTLSTDASSGSGNGTTGGNGAGGVTGALVAPVTSPDASQLKTKNTQKLSLTINVTDVLGQRAVDEPVTISAVSAANRQNVAATPTLLVNGQKSWSGVTDGSGKVIVTLSDPDGPGLKTMLKITAGKGASQTSSQTSAIFTVITSPDTPQANYWGHMSESVSAGGVTFERPKLLAELAGSGGTVSSLEQGETWALQGAAGAAALCGSRLPTKDQLIALQQAKTNVQQTDGWPVYYYYRSSTTKGTLLYDVALYSNPGLPVNSIASGASGNVSCTR
ncbi:inverse autotransporter beta domain-containing protein [Raoultella ornithinolytica]|uniref:inverse autotransporter beta domain-containing protein n=1 Tax=Raoultella ornithinolytica TaxID=54291 RepID=UPI0021B04AD9|nr:inverse autotransporter beta domain-containing protein [Raoultella ornithinolytica]MCT4737230.1 inverse autotransporter beta domain-containing protein [Raoultella ornithinolytica]